MTRELGFRPHGCFISNVIRASDLDRGLSEGFMMSFYQGSIKASCVVSV